MGSVQVEQVVHLAELIGPGQVAFDAAVAQVADVTAWRHISPRQVDGQIRRAHHAGRQPVIVIELGRQAIVQKAQVEACIKHSGRFPGKRTVHHLAVSKAFYNFGSITGTDVIKVVIEGFLLLIAAYPAVIAQAAVRRPGVTAGSHDGGQGCVDFA
jgi:hypothetical protein